MSPIIGLIPLVDEERESYWMLPGYMEGISEAGGIPVMLPLTEKPATLNRLSDICDGFLFTGGHDVSPSIYGETPDAECGVPCPQRDSMEKILLKNALDMKKPLLGICRGIQFINASLGGTLYQDIPTQHPSQLEHHQKPPYHLPSHDVTICTGSPLHQLLKKDCLSVNSYHHQAIRDLAPGLEPMAFAPDGLIEAVCLPDEKFFWAVQWHPEFSHAVDEDSRKIFSALVNACRTDGE